jgi:hypothetical protein
MNRLSALVRKLLTSPDSKAITVRPVLDLAIYLCAASAIEWHSFSVSELQASQGIRLTFTSSVLMLPLFLFVAAYAWMVFDSSLENAKKWAAALVNGGAAIWAVWYLLSLQGRPRDEGSFSPVLVFIVVIPAIFAVTAALILYSRKIGYIVGSVTICLAWAYLAWLAVTSWIFWNFYPDAIEKTLAFACFLSPLVFIAASVVVFSRGRLGYVVGLVAAMLAWPYFVYRERGYPYSANSWNILNLPDFRGEDLTFAKLTLVAMLLLVVATVCTVVRLFSPDLIFKNIRLRDRTWPVVVGSFVVSVAWFVSDAIPYTVPRPHHGIAADISVLYVEKRGFHFSEISISAFRDGKAYVTREERKPLWYRSNSVTRRVVLDGDSFRRIRDLVRSPEFKGLQTKRRTSSKRWDSDSWYIHGDGTPLLIYSNVDGEQPPKQIVDWFHAVESLPAVDSWQSAASKDVCLGFCYDPAPR